MREVATTHSELRSAWIANIVIDELQSSVVNTKAQSGYLMSGLSLRRYTPKTCFEMPLITLFDAILSRSKKRKSTEETTIKGTDCSEMR